jgi:hypothetical protein
MMFRFLTVLLTILSRAMKWSGLFQGLVFLSRDGKGKWYLEVPPFEPCPSQYAGPLPLITWPAAPVIVISVPEISIGLKLESLVVPKVCLG